MSMCIELLIQDTNDPLNADIKGAVLDVLRNRGLRLDVADFTPTAHKLAELSAVETGRCRINTYTS